MIYQKTVKGYFEENCFFAISEKSGRGFIIDPGAESSRLLACIRKNGWHIEKILLTHGHFDHIGAAEELRESLEIPVLAHERADEYLLNARRNLSSLCGAPVTLKHVQPLRGGMNVSLERESDYSIRVIEAPGHTTDSVIYYLEKEKAAFVGDIIFKGSPGEYRYPGGNLEDLEKTILEKVFALPEETMLYSGHSDPTTVGMEKHRYGIR